MVERDYTDNAVATNISREDFMAGYEGQRVEWVEGTVIEMPSIDERHDALSAFLQILLATFLELTTGGRILRDPMIVRLSKSSRAPDIIILLPDRLHQLARNEVIGGPDMVIEIVSPGSQRIDRHDKFYEYEADKISEYWIIDPIHDEALFYVLNDKTGRYDRQQLDDNGIYHCTVLNKLAFEAATLWQPTLPGVLETVSMVQTMLIDDSD